MLKISARRVNQLVKENVLSREKNGKFDLADSCESYYAWKFRSDGEINYDQEHALLEKAKREKAEIDLQERKETLLRAKDVEHIVDGMILTCKAKLLAIPTKAAPKIIGKSEIPAIVEVMRDEIYEALNELKEIPAEQVEEAADDEVDN